MVKSNSIWIVWLTVSSLMLQGCAVGPYRLQYLWNSEEPLSYYVDKASSIQYPTEEEPRKYDPALFRAPRSIESLDEVEPREVSLNECIQMALKRASVIRDAGSLNSPGNPILSRPSSAPSNLDPALQQSGFLFGNRGVEAALSDFDALATTNLTWGRNRVPQNLANSGISQGQALTTESFNMQSRIEKPFASGATAALQFDINYDGNNRSSFSQAFNSSYSGLLQGEIRQPLMAGAGTEFTRIAGPLNQSLRGVSGVSQGVLISRINSDISLTQFEQSIQTLVRDIEHAYWDLDLFLRLYDSEREAFRDLADFFSRKNIGQDQNQVEYTQAESQVLDAKDRISGSLADVLDREARLRRLCNMPLNDGTFLYPSDQPSEAEFKPMWEASIQEALANRVELRRQKWDIKSKSLQLKAARSLTRPRLDAVGQYRMNGLGDQLAFNGDGNLDSLASSIGGANNPGWSLGLQWSMPIGLRLSRTQVANYELQLRKSREMLKASEWEVAYELSFAMREMERWHKLATGSINRIKVARKYSEVTYDIARRGSEHGSDAANQYLQAKIRQRDVEQGYIQSIVEYNKAIAEMKFRRGTILVDNQIYLAEGNWHPAAANSAMKRAVERTRAFDAHHLRTEPMNFVGGNTDTAWESLGTDNRPTIPGALQRAAQPESTNDKGPPSNVPGIPDGVEIVPPENAVPKTLNPTPKGGMPPSEPAPAPPALDPEGPVKEQKIFTSQQFESHDHSNRLAVPAGETNDAGRVKL